MRFLGPTIFVLVLVEISSSRDFTSGKRKTPLHKVVLTQRGYIQFLRYQMPVPEITEFTFCLWVKSSNLTYDHSFFSYSRNESERLVRSWISARGRSVHLEIGGASIIALRTRLVENRWYHICQSWDNGEGRAAMWIDGRIVAQGHTPQMIGHKIPKNGDIVIGQEYTDFDKGFEEGIEGSILGFNLLLTSTFNRRSNIDDFTNFVPTIRQADDLEFGRKMERRDVSSAINDDKVPGLLLVELTFKRCEIGRASPFFEKSLMLVSWTRTPVRVFGGAVVKNVQSDCGQFTPIA